MNTFQNVTPAPATTTFQAQYDMHWINFNVLAGMSVEKEDNEGSLVLCYLYR